MHRVNIHQFAMQNMQLIEFRSYFVLIVCIWCVIVVNFVEVGHSTAIHCFFVVSACEL